MNVRNIGHSLQRRLLGKKRSDEARKAKRPERAARREEGENREVRWKKSVLKILTPEALGAARQGTAFFVRAAMEGRGV